MENFNKLLASVGIGSAKVDTKVKKNYYMQGELLEGIVEITGGKTDQKIAAINLKLMTLYGQEGSDRLTSTAVHTHKLNEPFVISTGEYREIPFSFRIPLDTPITMQDPKTGENVPPVWIDTDVDVKNAFDLSDKDFISIDPTEVHENILDAIRSLGLKFRQMESQKVPSGVKTKRVFCQQYEFVPAFGKYFRRLDELEVYLIQDDDETTVFFEVDTKQKGAFSGVIEKLNLDEHRGSVTFTNDQVLNNRMSVSRKFEEIIDDLL